jgi:hypothetical protein
MPVANQTSYLAQASVNFAASAREPFRTLRVLWPHALEEGEHYRVADTVTQNFEATRRDLAVNVVR